MSIRQFAKAWVVNFFRPGVCVSFARRGRAKAGGAWRRPPASLELGPPPKPAGERGVLMGPIECKSGRETHGGRGYRP
jgi:hypothetical protein